MGGVSGAKGPTRSSIIHHVQDRADPRCPGGRYGRGDAGAGGDPMAGRFTDCEGFHRRDFLKIGTTGLLGLSLPQLLRLEAQGARQPGKARKASSVIMLWLGGGPATIDMWDLKPNAA